MYMYMCICLVFFSNNYSPVSLSVYQGVLLGFDIPTASIIFIENLLFIVYIIAPSAYNYYVIMYSYTVSAKQGLQAKYSELYVYMCLFFKLSYSL